MQVMIYFLKNDLQPARLARLIKCDISAAGGIETFRQRIIPFNRQGFMMAKGAFQLFPGHRRNSILSE